MTKHCVTHILESKFHPPTVCVTMVKRRKHGSNIISYLNLPSTRAKIGVSDLAGNYTSCNMVLSERFMSGADFMHGQTQHYVSALLERGVRVLAYAGSYDFLCTWVGIRDWTLNLEWSGQEKFGQEELRNWTVNGRKAGVVRMFGGFAFGGVKWGWNPAHVSRKR